MQHTEDYSMTFLKQKINEIKIALFRTEETNSEFKLPNNIIETIKVDDDGSVLFLTAFKGYHDIDKMFDKTFFAYLDYYKKGSDCHLHLSGKVNIVHNGQEPNNTKYNMNSYGVVLIRMKITHAVFYENKVLTNAPWPQKIRSAINHLFTPYPRVYNFS